MENLVKFRCLGVVLCCAFQVNEVFGRKEAYINYDPTYPEPKFKLPLSRWDGEDPCDAFTNPADRTVNNLCQTDIKNTLEKDNGWSKLEVLCTNTGNLPVGVKPVCCLKKQKRSKHSFGFNKKTVLEIQVYLGTDKKMYARFSEPYDD
uniref:Uncharacterized protein n=1 Tax=Cacopsylla melanoneura TaxID=428564 RepID=A0A8D8T4M3_9HEMI